MKALNVIALTLVIVGAVNWGLVGLFGVDLVAALLGFDTLASTIVYVAVGLAGLWAINLYGKLGDRASDTRANSTAAGRDRTYDARDSAVAAQRADGSTDDRSAAQPQTRATLPKAPVQVAAGTTHDPNSNTTGTSVEPTRDVFPPKGEEDDARRLN
jgi:uncharacterized membrane protein YuzA (DUF378 family)